MKRAQKGSKYRAVIVAMVVGASMVGVGLAWPQERLLMERARPIVKLDADRDQVLWLSSDRLLLITTEQEGVTDDPTSGSTKSWRGFADLLDIRTGARTRLVGLTRLLRKVTVPPVTKPGRFQRSPDGTWLLWRPEENGEVSSPRVASLNGTYYRNLKTDYRRLDLFLDTHHLIQLSTAEPLVIVRDLLNATKDRKYSGPEQVKKILTQFTIHHPTALIVDRLRRNINQDDAEIDRLRMQDRIQEHLNIRNHAYRFPPPLERHEVKLPQGAKLLSLFDQGISPQQDAIFYQLTVERLPPLMAALQRIFSKFHSKPMQTQELWISRSDGQEMRDLGHVPVKQKKTGEYGDYLSDPQWLPDGQKISFVYGSTLYVVSAERENQMRD